MFQYNQNYIGFHIFFYIPNEWIDSCPNLQRLTDFLILAAGVRRYSLFNDNPVVGDQYFLEHLNIVVEIKEINDYIFLLQRRPDIPTLMGEGFDFDIFDSDAVQIEEVEDEEQGNATWGGQTDIEFHNSNPNTMLAIEAPNEDEKEENEKEEEEEMAEKKEKNDPGEVDATSLNLVIKKEPEDYTVKEEEY